MTAPSEDDGALYGHFKRQTGVAYQADSGNSVRFKGRHARIGKTAPAAFCPQVSDESLRRAMQEEWRFAD